MTISPWLTVNPRGARGSLLAREAQSSLCACVANEALLALGPNATNLPRLAGAALRPGGALGPLGPCTTDR